MKKDKTQLSEQDDARLSRLIQLKRCEKPDAEFWEDFQEQLRNRQLAALVERPSWRSRLGDRAYILLRIGASSAVFAAAVALLLLAVQQNADRRAEDAADMASMAPESPTFDVGPSEDVAASDDGQSLPQLFEGPAIYGVNVLASEPANDRYTLVASPKIFTAQSNAGQGGENEEMQGGLGALVIRTSHQF